MAICLCCRISEASKAFQMEKIEHSYENMNHFTVNLNREEKIIREIDFYRGLLFLWPFGQNCWRMKAAEEFSGRKGGFRISFRLDAWWQFYKDCNLMWSSISLQSHTVCWRCLFSLAFHSAHYNAIIGYLTLGSQILNNTWWQQNLNFNLIASISHNEVKCHQVQS